MTHSPQERPPFTSADKLSPHGNSAQIINAFKEKRFNLFYSGEIMDEYHDVLSRAKLGLRQEDFDDLLDEVSAQGFPVVPESDGKSFLGEDDRVFYDTAKKVDAYLVTGNIKHYPREQSNVLPADFVYLLNSEYS